MLVLTREAGTSIFIAMPGENFVVTIVKLHRWNAGATVLIVGSSAAHPGKLECRTADLLVEASIKIRDDVSVMIVDHRENRVRVGINAPKDCAIHRLEVYEAM